MWMNIARDAEPLYAAAPAPEGMLWHPMSDPRPYDGAIVDLWVKGMTRDGPGHFRIPMCVEVNGVWYTRGIDRGFEGPGGKGITSTPVMWMMPPSHEASERARLAIIAKREGRD
jgi:hypothetical protein